ncbi:MAG: hypothetical protein JO283_15925 [Bradyrhizobium sp.]|nr:hypothetical protein [Bradyrhizobium sp.]
MKTGFDADLVVLDGDPMIDAKYLAKVAYTTPAGTIIYQSHEPCRTWSPIP